MLRVVPAARFSTFLYVTEGHGRGAYSTGKGWRKLRKTPPPPSQVKN
jgi:hypothetical protein